MAKSYSKLRHIQESNKKIESSYFKKRDLLMEEKIEIVEDFVILMRKLLGTSYRDGVSILNQVQKESFFKNLKGILSDFGEYAGVAGVKSIDNVDDLIKAIEKSKVLSTHIFENIFNTPALRAEYEMSLLKSLGQTPIMKHLENSVLTGNLGFIRNIKNVYLKTTNITNDMLDKLVNSFARKNKISLSEFEQVPAWVSNKYVFGPGNRNRVIGQLYEKAGRLENLTFKPSEVKVTNRAVYHSVENGVKIEREILELKLPNNDNIMVYSSSGTGAPTLKQKGDWQIIPGMETSDPTKKTVDWFIKTEPTTQLTKGENKYLTDLATYLKKNGPDALGENAIHFDKTKIIPNLETIPVDKSNSRKMSHGGYAGSD